jgi:general secretion pathway protein F/type IV pilus assembly protein PilC
VTTFAYIARDNSGARVTGTLSGATRQVVLAELESRRLAPVEVREVSDRRVGRRGISTRQLAQAYRQVADLLRAGVPLLRALRLLGRSKANPRLAVVMGEVADAVADGERLADAMGAHADVFPDVQVAMVRAGERGGFLEQVLARMGMFLEHQADTRGRVVGNLIYPAALLVVGLGIVTFALVVFVPQFEPFYARIEVPFPTRVLMGASALARGQWPVLLAVLAFLVVTFIWARRQPALRRRLTRFRMQLPKLGPLLRSIAVARFCRILGTMLENGIPLLNAMQISRDATGNPILEDAIEEAIERVRAGETLAEPLAASGLFGEDVVEMISVGESANNLAEVLVTIAETVEKRVDRMMAVFLRLMEPALLLLLAAVVLFIFTALIVPMMRMSSAL